MVKPRANMNEAIGLDGNGSELVVRARIEMHLDGPAVRLQPTVELRSLRGRHAPIVRPQQEQKRHLCGRRGCRTTRKCDQRRHLVEFAQL